MILGTVSLAFAQLSPGDIIVADNGVNAIIKVDPTTGAQTIISSGGLFVDPTGIFIVPQLEIPGPPATPGGGNGNSDPPAEPGPPEETPGKGTPPQDPVSPEDPGKPN